MSASHLQRERFIFRYCELDVKNGQNSCYNVKVWFLVTQMCERKILTRENEGKVLNKWLINANLIFAKLHECSKHLGLMKGYGSSEDKINSQIRFEL